MKTPGASFLTHTASGATTLAALWKITRRDGQVFRFTDCDVDVAVPGDGTYTASTSFNLSAVDLTGALNVDTLDITSVLQSPTITDTDLLAGRWDGAAVEVAQVNYRSPADGTLRLRAGTIGRLEYQGERWVAEARGLMLKLQAVRGRVLRPTCDAELGDSRCTVSLGSNTFAGTVTSVQDASYALTASALAQPADDFRFGVVSWLSGNNAGLNVEVKSHATGGVLQLAMPQPGAIQVGDTFNIVRGCGKTRADCKNKFSNLVNFRGFPDVPGIDEVTRSQTT